MRKKKSEDVGMLKLFLKLHLIDHTPRFQDVLDNSIGDYQKSDELLLRAFFNLPGWEIFQIGVLNI